MHYFNSTNEYSVVFLVDVEKDKIDSIQMDDIENAIFSPDGKYIAVTTESIVEVDAQTHKKETVIKRKTNSGPLAYSPDGQYLLFTDNRCVVIWDVHQKMEYKRIRYDHFIQDFLLSPDNKYVWASGLDYVIAWHVETGVIVEERHFTNRFDGRIKFERLGVKYGHPSWEGSVLSSIAVSPDFRQFAFSDEIDIKVWNIPSFEQLRDETKRHFNKDILTPEERMKYYLE